jgi:hypothetical protein
MSDELAQIIEEARASIKDRPVMVSDGNPQEQLARAFDRHANRLTEAANRLRDVGSQNHLGPTVEGEAATYNIRLGAVEHEQSLFNTFRAQAAEARSMATGLREIGRRIGRTEGAGEDEINRTIGK